MYADEVVPGRELIAYNEKKLWVLYWSFLDFGPAALSNEDAWFTGLVLRSHMVKTRLPVACPKCSRSSATCSSMWPTVVISASASD